MIGNNLSPHHGRRFHMDAAGPSLAAITRVHLKNKDIQSAIGRKFNGNPNDTTTFITALDTLLDRTDLGPYARGTVSVLVSQYHTSTHRSGDHTKRNRHCAEVPSTNEN